MNKNYLNHLNKLMEGNVEDIVEAIDMLNETADSKLKDLAARRNMILTASKTNNTDNKRIDALEAENHALKETNHMLEDRLKEMEKAYDQLAKDLQNRCDRIEALKDELDKINKTKEYENAYCGECMECTDQEILKDTNELKCSQCGEVWERITEEEILEDTTDSKSEETKKGADKVVEKQPKAKEKVVRNNKLINCGPSVGDNEVLFIEKRRNNLHLWYGQIRIDNEIRNFHWSNELQKPVVYGVESLASLTIANELIREAVNSIDSKELTKYDMVPDHPDFGGFKARHYYGALEQGAYIYMTPAAQEDGKEEDIVFKGYINKHAFVVWRNGEVRFRHYNYINMTKPFEKHASKGFNTEQMMKDIDTLANTVLEQFEKAASKTYRRNAVDNNATDQGAAQNTNDNKVENSIDGLANADIGGLL